MNLARVIPTIITPAMQLLPPIMGVPAATAMLIAIGLQESRFDNRRQVTNDGFGPARGYWQFERGGGVRGVLEHAQTRLKIREALSALDYSPDMGAHECWEAIEHNDILACVFARLLLWTVPGPLCGPDESDRAWRQYLAGWRPGKPHLATWGGCYRQGWALVNAP